MSITVQDTQVDEQAQRDQRAAKELSAGLRALAAFVEANPQLASDLLMTFDTNNVPWIDAKGDARAYLATYARAAVRAGAKVTKDYSSDRYSHVNVAFGPVELHVYADREQVCERVVTGTAEVTTEVPDPEALAAVPKVKVTETVETFEWRCHPLLADSAPAAVMA